MSIPRQILNISFLMVFSFLMKESFSNPLNKETIPEIDITQCFEIINETTLEKKDFFYSNISTKEQCTKIALSLKYKENIFIPKYFHKCFPLCNSCYKYSQEKTNMQCFSCLNGFILIKGNCYIDKNYNSKKREKEINAIFNTLNINPNISSNDVIIKYIQGHPFLFQRKFQKKNNLFRKLYKIEDDFDDSSNAIFNREDQSTLTDNRTDVAYNFRIELSPFYILAKMCVEQGKYFIENNSCVDECTPHLEYYFNYTEIKILR